MQSSVEQVRAKAVRQVCPCRLPWEVFAEVRAEAKRLQHDLSALVRAQARHVEEVARERAALEAPQNWTEERDEEMGALADGASLGATRHAQTDRASSCGR